MATAVTSFFSFLRWRLVPVRYVGKMLRLRLRHLTPAAKPVGQTAQTIDREGYITGPTASPDLLQDLQALYQPRVTADLKPRGHHPFSNLSTSDDFTPDSPLMQLACSKDVLDVALDYFGGRVRLDSLQVLYSFATDVDALKESQKWHLDYADRRSLHCVMYLNDVTAPSDGPFVFVGKKDTARIGRSMIIRRITDPQFDQELGAGDIKEVYGPAGTSILIDPAACYHYGSRCKTARMAVFITFNSDAPFVQSTPLLRANKDKVMRTIKTLRPDLDTDVVDRLVAE